MLSASIERGGIHAIAVQSKLLHALHALASNSALSLSVAESPCMPCAQNPYYTAEAIR